MLSPQSTWDTLPLVHNARDLTWGDVDGDGDLDLVVAVEARPVVLYRNDGLALESTVAWSSRDSLDAFAVALGDVDGDRHPDLVVAVFAGPNLLYRGQNGTFEPTPSWASTDTSLSVALSLADFDGDGDDDLVVANASGRNALHRNDDGDFSVPIRFEPADDSRDIAGGDLDNDGDLDIVVANSSSPSLIWRNDAFSFQGPDSLSSSFLAESVEIADMNSDGVLDVVLGFNGGANQVRLLREDLSDSVLTWGGLESTTSIAIADVDLDGDLDVAEGNSDEQVDRLYLNDGLGNLTANGWSSELGLSTRAISLADVDGDGRPDVTVASIDATTQTIQPIRQHANQGPLLAPGPWVPPLLAARDMAVDDLDGDGFPDVVVGSFGAPDVWFQGTPEGLSDQPLAIDSSDSETLALALGDVDDVPGTDLVSVIQGVGCVLWPGNGDGFSTASTVIIPGSFQDLSLADLDQDGDLDVICANRFGSNLVYENEAGQFSLSWDSSSPNNATWAVVAGDVDGDRDTDVVFLDADSTRFHENVSGVLSATPRWIVGEGPGAPRDAALGDVDGDGDLDLVQSRSSQTAAWIENDGGFFTENRRVLQSGTNGERVALVDVDVDGDLDLVLGLRGSSNRILLNGPAGFSSDASVEILGTNRTQALAHADFDQDGDVDFAFGSGNNGGLSSLHEGLRLPPLPQDPQQPAAHRAGNPAFLRNVSFTSVTPNELLFSATAVDVESDFVTVHPEFSFEGSGLWEPMLPAPRLVPSSPEGRLFTFTWDYETIPFDPRPVVVRLAVVSDPSSGGSILAPRYHVDLGPRVPLRPEAMLSSNLLSFPVLTVGDIEVRSLRISNDGNAPLDVTIVASPPVVAIAGDASISLSPGQSDSIHVRIAPTNVSDEIADVQIQTNEFGGTTRSIALQVPAVLGLDSSVDFVPETPPGFEFPPASAITLLVAPENPMTHVDWGQVFFRPALGASATWDSLALAPIASGMLATIPATAVTEADLELFVRLHNGIVSQNVWGSAEAPELVNVSSPESFSVALPEDDVGAGQSVLLLPQLAPGSVFESGTLFYRRGGDAHYDSTEIAPQQPLVVEIPEEVVGERGLQFWARIQTLTRQLTFPPANPRENPEQVSTRIENLTESRAEPQPARVYRMVSFPMEFDAQALDDLLVDEPGFGDYASGNWRSFRYDPDLVCGDALCAANGCSPNGCYVEFSESDDRFLPAPGRAYWLVSRDPHVVDTEPAEGVSTSLSTQSIGLSQGWNQIGNPFAFPVRWGDVEGFDQVEAHRRAGSGWAMLEAEDEIEPFSGYFVLADEPLTLNVPPLAAPVTAHRQTSSTPSGWTAKLRVAGDCPDHSCWDEIELGMLSGSVDEWDALDARQPPAAPGNRLAVSIANSGWSTKPGRYRRDVRSPSAGQVWDLEIFSLRGPGEATISLDLRELPPRLGVYLFDREQQTVEDLRAEANYELLTYETGTPYRLRLAVGAESYLHELLADLRSIPARVVLDQNAPNPFNPATRIRFGLPEPGQVSLDIFDVRGTKIASLLDDEFRTAGFHSVLWQGTDGRGRGVASGVYLYQLRTESKVLVQRMTLLR